MAQFKKGILDDKDKKPLDEILNESMKAIEEGKELPVPLAEIKQLKTKYSDKCRNAEKKMKYKDRYKGKYKESQKKYQEKNKDKINARRRENYQEKKNAKLLL